MSYQETFKFWLEDSYFDYATKQELLAIRNDEKEVEDRFYRDLEFGTGGLRGVIGAGTYASDAAFSFSTSSRISVCL